MYTTRTPRLVKALYSSLTWNFEREGNEVYLTFDDGPHPEITPRVLDLLKAHQAKATFFCVAANVEKYPEVFERILREGHSVGNHTYDHCNGWKVNDRTYFKSVARAKKFIPSTRLFRPPHGRISRTQASVLKDHFEIIMWDVLAADFDPSNSPDQCLKNVTDNIQEGSIVVFHDSAKAVERMIPALEGTLAFLDQKGWKSRAIPSEFPS